MGKRVYGTGTVSKRVRADGTTAWRCLIRTPGGERLTKTCATEPEAERWLLERALELRAGTYREPSRMTVLDVIEAYIERGATRWQGATEATYRQRLDAHIAPAIGSIRATELTVPRMQAWVDRMQRGGASPSLVHSCVRVVSGAMKEAVRLGIVERNPTVGLALPSMQIDSVGQVWTAEQVGRVLAQLDGDAMYGALYRVVLMTGMRPGEARALRWDAIDMRRRLVRVHGTITKDAEGREVIGTRTKGKKNRAVVVPMSVITALQVWREVLVERQRRADHWAHPELVFPGAEGRMLRSNAWERKHTRLCAKAQVPKIRLHDLRHTYATLHLEMGTHPKIVQEALGHKSIQQTLDTYSHVSLDLQERAASRLDALLTPTRTDQNKPRQHATRTRARRTIGTTLAPTQPRK